MLKLQYEGTEYAGWQRQKNAVTVQGLLERVLYTITGEAVSVIGCSRTDSGVHADGYVCNFKTESALGCERFIKALNSILPEDIVISSCREVSQDFNSRYDSKLKTYIYTIDNSDCRDVFMRRFAWHYPHRLELEKMQSAAACFCGTHDFCGFMSTGGTVRETVRTISACEVNKNGSIITISITGNGFLYNMVRIIAGTLVYVGNGRINADEMENIIASQNRRKAGITAPPQGLCLAEVIY